jgi:hypothetical protein
MQSQNARTSRWNLNRLTVWPSQMNMEACLEEQWLEEPSFQQTQKRWTGAFDNEARASRMSAMVGNTLLPPSSSTGKQWPGSSAVKRSTWISPLQKAEPQTPVWQGEFDVERRPSFLSHSSLDFEKEPEKPKRRSTIKPEQIIQANSSHISEAVLEYPFEGNGTTSDPYLVHWIPADVDNPMNFSSNKKWTNAMILAFAIFMVSIASSGFSQGT